MNKKNVGVSRTKVVFITKDSGKRVDYESGMRRDVCDDKPRFCDLLIEEIPYEEQMLTRYANLRTRGAKKYGNRNCELSNTKEELKRYKASAFRHFIQWLCGNTEEDHASAIWFNVAMAEMVKYKLKEEQK